MKKNKILKNKMLRKGVKDMVDGLLGVLQKIAWGEDLRYFDDVCSFVLNMSPDEFAEYKLLSDELTDPEELLADVLPGGVEVEVDPYDPEVYI